MIVFNPGIYPPLLYSVPAGVNGPGQVLRRPADGGDHTALIDKPLAHWLAGENIIQKARAQVS